MIDGTKIDEINDTYMYIYHNILNSINKKLAYYRLNPNNEKLLIATQSKLPFSIHIEVPLYFTQITGLAFPLISNIHSNFSINLQIRSLESLTIFNKYTTLIYKDKIKMTLIYSIIYLDEYECKLFNTMRHEYLYEKKIYNTPIQLDQTKLLQSRYHISFNCPIKDIFYYIQLESIRKAKQYYNFTYNYLLPELHMTTRNKIIYVEQIYKLDYYDIEIKNLFEKLIRMRDSKINILIVYNINNNFTAIDLSILYNNLTDNDILIIESYFTTYYENKLNNKTIDRSQLYLNSIERFNLTNSYTNKIIPYESYTSIISGLEVFKFSLYPLEYQPSGYCNFLQLKPEIQLTLTNTEDISTDDIIRSYIIARSYNIIRFMSGISGIAW